MQIPPNEVLHTMSQKPNPTKCNPPAQADKIKVEEHRNVFCRDYNSCTDLAARKDWLAFSCTKCPHFARDKAPSATAFARNQPGIGQQFPSGG
jgi:hypothetical protein